MPFFLVQSAFLAAKEVKKSFIAFFFNPNPHGMCRAQRGPLVTIQTKNFDCISKIDQVIAFFVRQMEFFEKF